MGSLRNAGLIAHRELRRWFASRRGHALIVLLLLFGSLPSGIRIWTTTLGSGADRAQLAARNAATLVTIFGVDAAESVSAYPAPLVTLTVLILLVLPLLALVAGHDAIGGDIEGGAMRFWLSRTSPASVVVGRFAGLWASVLAMTLLAHAILWVAVVVFGGASAASVFLNAAPRLFLACAISALPYTALAIATSTLPGSASRALWVGLVILVVLWLLRAVRVLSGPAARLLLPGSNDAFLLSRNLSTVLAAVGCMALWTSCALVVASLALRRRSV